MPFPKDEEMFRCVMCPCCVEGCVSPGAFGTCCAIRLESLLECDPWKTKNFFVDQRVQECCLNVACVCPLDAQKVKPVCGLCNAEFTSCASLTLPSLCFTTCVAPEHDIFAPADKVCCKTHCYCCVSGYYCVFPDCLSAKVKGTANCAPFATPAEPCTCESSQQVCFNYSRIAIPRNPEIPAKIGCCDIVCMTFAEAEVSTPEGSNPTAEKPNGPAAETSVQVASNA
jgi:hypothetical protein